MAGAATAARLNAGLHIAGNVNLEQPARSSPSSTLLPRGKAFLQGGQGLPRPLLRRNSTTPTNQVNNVVLERAQQSRWESPGLEKYWLLPEEIAAHASFNILGSLQEGQIWPLLILLERWKSQIMRLIIATNKGEPDGHHMQGTTFRGQHCLMSLPVESVEQYL